MKNSKAILAIVLGLILVIVGMVSIFNNQAESEYQARLDEKSNYELKMKTERLQTQSEETEEVNRLLSKYKVQEQTLMFEVKNNIISHSECVTQLDELIINLNEDLDYTKKLYSSRY